MQNTIQIPPTQRVFFDWFNFRINTTFLTKTDVKQIGRVNITLQNTLQALDHVIEFHNQTGSDSIVRYNFIIHHGNLSGIIFLFDNLAQNPRTKSEPEEEIPTCREIRINKSYITDLIETADKIISGVHNFLQTITDLESPEYTIILNHGQLETKIKYFTTTLVAAKFILCTAHEKILEENKL